MPSPNLVPVYLPDPQAPEIVRALRRDDGLYRIIDVPRISRSICYADLVSVRARHASDILEVERVVEASEYMTFALLAPGPATVDDLRFFESLRLHACLWNQRVLSVAVPRHDSARAAHLIDVFCKTRHWHGCQATQR